MRRFLLFPVVLTIFAHVSTAQEALRGEVRVDLEPVYGFSFDEEYPLDPEKARDRALEEAAFFFGGMIYGWSFHYDVGEKARNIEEKLELSPMGTISKEDPNMEFSDTEIRDMRLHLWSDYRTSDSQRRRLSMWRSDSVRSAQAYGQAPLDKEKYAALEDAARAALRAILRGNERNRPKEVSGYISLSAFPRFWLDGGRWIAAARFYIEINEILPFAAY
jgi:hypothetical protein